MKKFLLLSIALLLPSLAFSADDPPHWNVDFNVAQVKPKLDEWDTYYDGDPLRVGLGLGYKITRQIEINTTLAFIKKSGQGALPLNNSVGGNVTLTLIPFDVSLIYRLVLKEDQAFVPYIGGGWSRIYYRQSPQDSDVVKGAHDGYHFKLGLQYLLDPLDKKAAAHARRQMGIKNTYLFIEALFVEAEENDANLGGDSIGIGIIMEH